MTKRVLTLVACVAALAVPPVNAWAGLKARSAKSVTKFVFGTQVICHKWGPLKLEVKISKSPGSAKFRILDVKWPVWPQHTVRSVFINEKALPLLQQQVLQLQSAKIESISGATNISDSFKQSLQAALLAAAKA